MRSFKGKMIFTFISYLLLLDLTIGEVYKRNLSDKVVSTSYGKIRGLLMATTNPQLPPVVSYLGIQYAAQVGGNSRFMPPKSPTEKWDGIRVALDYRPVCPQKEIDEIELRRTMPYGRVQHYLRLKPFLTNQLEECLNLNIFVPYTAHNKTRERPFPVMVYFHGDSYSVGTGNAYDGSVLSSFGQVIVVTLNYRLGVLGFMSSGDDVKFPSNYALLDQVAALQWIKDNIEAFGGDANRVTLFGHSTGAAMIQMLMVSPVAKNSNLFHRVILQSGSALSTWAVSQHPFHYTMKVAENVNCSQSFGNSEELVNCLKKVPVDELVNSEVAAHKYFTSFAPFIARMTLPKEVHNLVRQNAQSLSNIDMLIGVTKHEGTVFFNQSEIEKGISELSLMRKLKTFVRNVYEYHRQKIYDILLHHYTEWDQPTDDDVRRENLVDLLGDGEYASPVVDTANKHSSVGGNTYFYSWGYPSRLDTYPRWASGAHGEELMYIFGSPLAGGSDPFPDGSYSRNERMLSEAVMRYWTNFAKSGNPNESGSKEASIQLPGKGYHNEQWLRYDRNKRYLQFGSMRPTMKTHYKGSKMSLWLDLIPKIHNSDDLEPKYHLLREYYKNETFDEGTKPLNFNPPPPPTEKPTTPDKTTGQEWETSLQHTEGTQGGTYLASDSTKRSSIIDIYTNPTVASNISAAASVDKGGLTMTLSIVIPVGCGLLLINIIAFVATVRQRRQMQREEKLREQERELEKDLQSQHFQNARNNAHDMGENGGLGMPIHQSSGKQRSHPHVVHPESLGGDMPHKHSRTCPVHGRKLSDSSPNGGTPKLSTFAGPPRKEDSQNSDISLPNGEPHHTIIKRSSSSDLCNHVHPTTVV